MSSRPPVAARRRVAAAVALTAYALAALLAAVVALTSFPTGLVVAVLLVAAVATVLGGLLRHGRGRRVLVAAGIGMLVLALFVFARGRVLVEAVAAALFVALGTEAAHRATRRRARLPRAPRPTRPVLVWNPRAGGGRAARVGLAAEAEARGIEVVELGPDDDLTVLLAEAVAGGADALAAAGGDGTQSAAAAVAAEHDLPFACIPAGTRNHFALDLGVDRDDLVGALDALVDGRERVVDLGTVNGRVFVNNVSLGVYAEAVRQEGYRDAKVQTLLDTIPRSTGGEAAAGNQLRWRDAEGTEHTAATVLLVSNNPYRLGSLLASGTRPRLDTGELGVVALGPLASGDGSIRITPFVHWSAPEFRVEADGPVPAGVDGEAVVFDPPVEFGVRPGALRVRIAREHPGASPSAGLPPNPRGALRAMARIALGRELE